MLALAQYFAADWILLRRDISVDPAQRPITQRLKAGLLYQLNLVMVIVHLSEDVGSVRKKIGMETSEYLFAWRLLNVSGARN